MSATDVVSVEVPDIGDFDDVPVIEILVSPGDTVETDDPLLTLESDKATMDVPAPFAGTIKEHPGRASATASPRASVLLTMEQAGSAAGQSEASAAASDGAATEAAGARRGGERRRGRGGVGARGRVGTRCG